MLAASLTFSPVLLLLLLHQKKTPKCSSLHFLSSSWETFIPGIIFLLKRLVIYEGLESDGRIHIDELTFDHCSCSMVLELDSSCAALVQ